MSRIEQIRKLLAANGDDAFLLYSLGMELLGEGTAAQAADAFGRVLEVDPNYLAAYTQGAAACRQMGDVTGALRLLEKGLALAKSQGDQHTADRIILLLEALRPAS